MYFLNDGWYRLTPIPELSLPPTTMKPMTKPSWHYNDPGSLEASGIYTNTELENLREHIMFPAEKNEILNTMARGTKGEPTISQGISLSHLFRMKILYRKSPKTHGRKSGELFSHSAVQEQESISA